ncbi:unnamed protein product [Miscanthus lutarioriparius]|uniref:Uncharacterized protein n=1 Tax=Miscanthus lutarioriparius TaxID=422564 RepID=A0A811QLR0_9POAL|nr:unnamed protein product [Miscanthus lutarioriparius]
MEESTKQLIQRGLCVCACGCGGGARGGEVVPRGGTEELVVDLEKGQLGHRHRHREEDPPPATVADALLARDEEMGTTADKAIKCILRGLIVLLWVYLVDWMRRYMTTHSTEELMFTICPLGTLVIVVSVFFCLLMGCLDECMDEPEHSTNSYTE